MRGRRLTTAWASGELGPSSGCVSNLLCDFGQVAAPLWASVSPPVTVKVWQGAAKARPSKPDGLCFGASAVAWHSPLVPPWCSLGPSASLGHQIFTPPRGPLCPGVRAAQGAGGASPTRCPHRLWDVHLCWHLPPATGFSLLCCRGSVPRARASPRKGMLGISFPDAGKPVNIKVLNCNFFSHNCF